MDGREDAALITGSGLLPAQISVRSDKVRASSTSTPRYDVEAAGLHRLDQPDAAGRILAADHFPVHEVQLFDGFDAVERATVDVVRCL